MDMEHYFGRDDGGAFALHDVDITLSSAFGSTGSVVDGYMIGGGLASGAIGAPDWLNIDLQTTLLYDDDIMITDKDGNIGPRAQFREFLMISVGYTF